MAHEPVDGRRGAPDVCVIEMGGTVGDIESMPFIEVRADARFLVPSSGSGSLAARSLSSIPEARAGCTSVVTC